MSVMATKKIRRLEDATVGVCRKVRNVRQEGDMRCMPSCLDWGNRFSETGVEVFVGSSKEHERRSCRLAAVNAPVGGAAGRKGLGNGGGSGRFGLDGTSTEHNTAGEDGRLSTIVVGHLVLGVVNEDLGGTGPFPTRHLWLGRVGGGEGVDTLRVGEDGGIRVGRA